MVELAAVAAPGRGWFSGRRCLVVGGTSGIGAAIAERLALLGGDVEVAGLRADLTPPALARLVRARELDLTAGDQLEELVSGQDRLDVLVNAAGTIARGAEYDREVFARVLDVNLTGTMRACVAAKPLLEASRGCVVNVASMLSFFGGPLVPAYTASKGGVAQLTKALAVAWAPDGVRVNAVAPGWIRTELTRGVRDAPDAERRIVERTPMGRWGEPEEVAGAAAFLAGPDAGFITGAVLPVDGGYLAA
jgi:NAD(P)-dependent dehydrogenase (short-subunit alcohol dehydrogenase family)